MNYVAFNSVTAASAAAAGAGGTFNKLVETFVFREDLLALISARTLYAGVPILKKIGSRSNLVGADWCSFVEVFRFLFRTFGFSKSWQKDESSLST